MSSLGAQRIAILSLHMPDTGAPRADVILEGGALPAEGTSFVLTCVDLAVTMTVLRSDYDAPNKPHVVLVGGLGWEREVTTPPSYQNDNGVTLSTVLADLATRANETIEQPAGSASVILGDHWSAPASRPGEPLRLRDVLAALYEQGFCLVWRVDPDGVTRFGLRTGVAVSARATVLRADAGVGLTVVGLDSPAAFLPGNTLAGKPIRRLVVSETPGDLRAEVWSDARLSFRSRILRMVAEAFPQLFYNGLRTYRVAGVGADGRLDLVPSPDFAHLQALPKVEQWVLGGAEVTPVVGSSVAVMFRDSLPSRPVVVAFERAHVATPTKVTINAGHVELAGGATESLLVGAEITGRRAVCYGDNIAVPVLGGGAAAGVIVQNPLTTPNAISRVSV